MTPAVRESYLSRKQLAAELGLSLRTIAKYDSEGMPRHQWGLRTVRYRLSEVEAWLAGRAGRIGGTAGSPSDGARHQRKEPDA